MSFAGDLDHLPIVDVIQLLHATKKSGTLFLRSEQGEGQLIFSLGSIVCATHPDSGMRIGRILVDSGKLSQEVLDRTLAEQERAGAGRKPLIAILIEAGTVAKEEAYKGLELLIELTIVEVLSWNGGTFILDVSDTRHSAEFEALLVDQQRDFHRSTQNILMDALRIYDERRRDGTEVDESIDDSELDMAFGPSSTAPAKAPVHAPEAPLPSPPADDVPADRELSAADLGLDVLDTLERKIPAVFSGIRDYDPAAIHRTFLRNQLQDVPADQQERLLAFLLQSGPAFPPQQSKALILFGHDECLQHVVMTACKRHGFFVFASDDESSLELILAQAQGKGLEPVLLLPPPDDVAVGLTPERLTTLRREQRARYPGLIVVQMSTSASLVFALQALGDGARTILPLPQRTGNARYGEEIILLIDTLFGYIDALRPAPAAAQVAQLAATCAELERLGEPPEIALRLLQAVATLFPRALTLIVGKGELLAERSFGCRGEGRQTASLPLKFRIPLTAGGRCEQTIAQGRPFFGPIDDPALNTSLQGEIGAPVSPQGLLLPLAAGGRVVALIYADFGLEMASPVALDGLDLLARHAGLVLDATAARKRV